MSKTVDSVPRSTLAALIAATGLLPALLWGCGDGGAEEGNGSALVELSTQIKASGLVERLDSIDRRLTAIEATTADLAKRVRAGAAVAAAGTPGSAEGGAKAGGGKDNARGTADAAGDGGGNAVGGETGDGAGDGGGNAVGGERGDGAGDGSANAVGAEFALTWPEPEAPAPVVVWHSYRGKEKEAFEECARAFSARFPKIPIDAQEVPFSALRDKLVVTIPRGTGPDLFVYAHNNIGDWLLKGQILVPLSSFIEKYDSFESLERFLPDTVKALAYNGTLYGLPLAFKSHVLFINRKLVSGKAPSTVDEMIAMGKKAMEGGGEGEEKTYGLVYDAGLLYNHALWAHAFGATILDERGNAHLDTPEMIESVKLVRSFVADHAIMPDLNDAMATFLFNSNKVAFAIKGSWFLGEVDPGVDYEVALLPAVSEGKVPKPFLGSEGIFLSNCAKNREAAFQFMRYVVSDEAARVRYLEGAQLVANKWVYDDPELVKQANPAMDVFRKQANQTVIMSAMPQMQAVWSSADNALRNAIFGTADVEETLRAAQVKVTHDIASMGK